MNERIKELAKQAGMWRQHYDIGEESPAGLEKFAELIVKECGNYLNSPEFIGRRDLDWAMVLNEHFGVK